MKTLFSSASLVGAALLSGLLLWPLKNSAAPPDPAPLVAGNTVFALNLYQQFAATNAGNIFFSPFSISTCLAMLEDGAAGQTASQMDQALSFNPDQPLGPAFGALQSALNTLTNNGKIQFTIANGLWAQTNFPFLPPFLDNAATNFQAAIAQVDFSHAAGITDEINDWVSQKTQGLITNLFAPGALNAATRLALVNAIYFKGAWADKFQSSNTVVQPFYTASNQPVGAPLMRQTETIPYYADDLLQAVELPYDGSNAAMVVLLPQDTNGLASLDAALTPAELARVLANLAPRITLLTLPKFNLAASANLIPDLQNLGMIDAFVRGGADFSGIDGGEDLYVTVVAHKAVIAVDENGSTAAGATGAGATTGAVALPEMLTANRPFVFLILDTSDNAVLFLGRMVDPTVGAVTLSAGPAAPPPPPVPTISPGTFAGLFCNPDNVSFESSGQWNVAIAANGSVTGAIGLPGKTYAFAGRIAPGQTFLTVSIHRKPNPDLLLKLQFSASGQVVGGNLSSGAWSSTLTSDPMKTTTAARVAPLVGAYSLTFLSQSDGSTSPGYGSHASLNVAADGAVHLTGALADGAIITASGNVSALGNWPLYIPLYSGKGALFGWITFTNEPGSRLTGSLHWIKTGAAGSYYRRGFTNAVTALGSILQP